MMKKQLLTLVIIVIPGFFSGCKQNSIEVKNILCENFNDPKGISTLTPRFSWILESKARCQVQSAYHIIVASTLKNLKNNYGDLWDTKKIESPESILIDYEGRELKPAASYYWKVKVWNQDGDDSGWSNTGKWQMGLLNTKDWGKAKWIGYHELPDSMRVVPGLPQDDKRLGNKAIDRAIIPLFRREFELNRKIKEASLFISGSGSI